jgi:hypothetical protein
MNVVGGRPSVQGRERPVQVAPWMDDKSDALHARIIAERRTVAIVTDCQSSFRTIEDRPRAGRTPAARR